MNLEAKLHVVVTVVRCREVWRDNSGTGGGDPETFFCHTASHPLLKKDCYAINRLPDKYYDLGWIKHSGKFISLCGGISIYLKL